MAVVYKKSKLGKEDIHFDATGASAKVQTEKSDGNFRSVSKINSTHIPTTTATRAKKSADATVTTTVNVDTALQELYDDSFALGVPDAVTIENSAGTLQVKANGIDTAQLAADSVTTAEIAAATIATADIALLAIDNTLIAADTVRQSEMALLSVGEPELIDDSVTQDKLDNGQIKRLTVINVESPGAGVDISERAEMITPTEECTITKVSFIPQGASLTIDNASPVTVAFRNITAGADIATKTYNTATQPPSSNVDEAYTPLTNSSPSSSDVLGVVVTQSSGSALGNIAAFLLCIEYEQKDA